MSISQFGEGKTWLIRSSVICKILEKGGCCKKENIEFHMGASQKCQSILCRYLKKEI